MVIDFGEATRNLKKEKKARTKKDKRSRKELLKELRDIMSDQEQLVMQCSECFSAFFYLTLEDGPQCARCGHYPEVDFNEAS